MTDHKISVLLVTCESKKFYSFSFYFCELELRNVHTRILNVSQRSLQ